MEPNNIEKQIREKLNSREIQPSAQAWDRLDAMLSVAEEKKTKRSFGWLYIAAAILVFVSVGMFLYNQESGIPTTNEVVGVESTHDSVNENTSEIAVKENTIPASETASTNQTVTTQPVQVTTNKSAIAQSQKSFNPSINQKANSSSIINKEKEIEYQINNDVAIKNIPKTITPDKEIVIVPKATTDNSNDLASANVKKSDNTSKVKINANSLLSEVDGELDLTFREKVFKKVNKNYKEVKVALANRNNL